MKPDSFYEAIADDLWRSLGISSGGYTGEIETDIINIVKALATKHCFYSELAKTLDLPEKYVMLIQEILCSAEWCNYGTSPRGCWLDHDIDKERLFEAISYYQLTS